MLGETHPTEFMPRAEIPGQTDIRREGIYQCRTWCYTGPGLVGEQCRKAARHDQSTRCQMHSAAATQERRQRIENAAALQ